MPKGDKMACTCQACGNKYRVDLNIPDAVWARIGPPGSSGSCGMLCAPCIGSRLEALGEYAAYELMDLARPAPNSAMDAIGWLEWCFQYVPDCTKRDDLRRFIEAQRHQ